jgi:prevent-host-death family protein
MNAQGKITTMTSREFNQHTGRAKLAADKGPVFVTDRGKPAYVLLSHEDYERLTSKPMNILEALADPSADADFDYDFERARGSVRPADFGEGT